MILCLVHRNAAQPGLFRARRTAFHMQEIGRDKRLLRKILGQLMVVHQLAAHRIYQLSYCRTIASNACSVIGNPSAFCPARLVFNVF